MRAAVMRGNRIQIEEVPEPTPGPGQVVLAPRATGICGSDLHVDDWTPSYAFIAPSIPVTIGHEFVGVAQNGPLAGRRVVVQIGRAHV